MSHPDITFITTSRTGLFFNRLWEIRTPFHIPLGNPVMPGTSSRTFSRPILKSLYRRH